MKTLVRYFALFALLSLIHSPLAIAHELPSSADRVHFQPFDYYEREREHRPAAKRLADLNIGEPRIVRLIYFLPNDRPFRADVVQRMKDEIRNLQAFFSEQMQVHGYGDRTFRFETDEQGEPLVHRVDGQHPDSYYLDDTVGPVREEIEQTFDPQANIYLIVVDNSTHEIGTGRGRAGGVGVRKGKSGGDALVPSSLFFATAAHELGHAFGLHHDFRNNAYIMSYGSSRDRLSACHAEFLVVHPYFNADSPIEVGTRPTIELISPHTSGRGTSASVRLKVRDSEGVHQVLLTNSGSSRRACRGLAGKKDAVVDFYYYDVIPPDGVASLPNPTAHRVAVHAFDIDGNESSKASFVLDVSKWPRPHPQMLEKTSGDEQQGSGGIQLVEPFVVSLLDQSRSAIAGVAVTFVVTAGGGTLSVETAFTDASGQAATRLTLGRQPGTNTVEASVDGLEPVTFTVTSIGQTPHSLTKVSGDGQEGLAGLALAAPFVVSVLDEEGAALAGVAVTFSVTAGEGILSATTATTDVNGHATTTLTLILGSDTETNTVSATVEGLEPETFTATVVGQAIPDSLAKVSGDGQEGTVGDALAEPLVVSVLDEDGTAIAGAVVTFSVIAGGGILSATTATTDANGHARTWLTLGSEMGTNTVEATGEGLEPVTFTATGRESPLASLFDAFFGGGKRVALPDSPQLTQNVPNPFNSQTVLSYFLHAPGPMRLEVFALTGQRVAVLLQGPQKAGYHRLRWDARDDGGRPLASGIYLYRLVTAEEVLTRKLVLLR